MTANKFSQDAGAIFNALAAPFCHETGAFVPASDKIGAKDGQRRASLALQETQQLRT